MEIKSRFLLLLVLFCQPRAKVSFFREDVSIEIGEKNVAVSGRYFFRNNTDKGFGVQMFYPFPLDSLTSYPDSIHYPGQFSLSDSGIYFNLRFAPKEEKDISIYYRQAIRGKLARYIVTTTAHWRRPIKEANFTVLVPEHFRNVKISLSPDSVRRKEKVYYYLHRRNFLPKEDIYITWD